MLLQNLPPAALAMILDGVHSSLAIELYKCGNIELSSKLVHGGVRKMDLCRISEYGQFSWPFLLSEFNLTSLSLVANRDSQTKIGRIGEALRQLNSGLETLILRFHGSMGVLTGEDESGKVWDLRATHGNLRHLEISDERPPSLEKLGDDILDRLPSSLTVLTLRGGRGPNFSNLSALPPSLTSLELFNHSIGIKSVYVGLPNTLTHICQHSMTPGAWFELAKSNPPLLPLLIFPPFDEYTIRYHYQQNVPLPSNMQCLILPPTLIEAHFFQLPSRLTVLHLPPDHPSIDDKWILSCLPYTVTDILAHCFDWEHISTKSWSSQLSTLSINGSVELSISNYHKLPRSLTHLAFVCNIKQAREHEENPDSEFWTHLSAQGRQCIEGIEKEAWLKRKQELIIEVKSHGEAFRRELEIYIKRVEHGALYGLPVSLRCINVMSVVAPKNWEFFRCSLPPSLTQLSVPMSNIFSELSRFFSSFFPALTSAIMWEQIQGWNLYGPNLNFPIFPNNCKLSHLTLTNFTETVIPNILKNLPSSLYSLVISTFSDAFQAQDFYHLPRHLKQLKLKTSTSIEPKDAWVHALPRSLELLDSNSAVYGCDLKNLPPSLTSVKLAIVYATLDDVLSMPHTIATILLKPAPPSREDGHLSQNDWYKLLVRYAPFWRLWKTDRAEIEAVIAEPLVDPVNV